jgi:hypothetical protein
MTCRPDSQHWRTFRARMRRHTGGACTHGEGRGGEARSLSTFSTYLQTLTPRSVLSPPSPPSPPRLSPSP